MKISEWAETFARENDLGHWSEDNIEEFGKILIRRCLLVCQAVADANELHGHQEFSAGAAKCVEVLERDFGIGS